MSQPYDLAIIGAGSGGLTAAGFAARLGRRVALIEKNQIGGDCTWTGCVPSKALLKAAKTAYEVRTASRFGIASASPAVDMAKVRDYVRGVIEKVYQHETPEQLRAQGIDVHLGEARFLDSHTVSAGTGRIAANHFLIATGARPWLPPIDGLDEVPYLTYEQIFNNDRLPEHLIVIGGGPIGAEMAQAYGRLGAGVTIIDEDLLPKDEPEARRRIAQAFEREGIEFVQGFAKAARRDGERIVIALENREVRGDMLLVAAGRRPNLSRLDLDQAGVDHTPQGIPVDDKLRTNVPHIFAAGDVVGGYQFTHFAGWQAFQAVRNAFLPGSDSGFTDIVPWVTFTDPEVAHVGLTEAQARAEYGTGVTACQWEMSATDRAVCEADEDGFVKLVTKGDGVILGATIVAARAGEAITEFILAVKHRWKPSELAGAIHAYPTYSTAAQQLAAQMTIDGLLSGTSGRILLGLSKIIR